MDGREEEKDKRNRRGIRSEGRSPIHTHAELQESSTHISQSTKLLAASLLLGKNQGAEVKPSHWWDDG